MSVSIATKPPTKRAKKLILRGDHGKHARHDNSHVYREKNDPKPVLGIRGGIILDSSMEDLAGGSDATGPVQSQLVHTTQSAGFDVTLPTHRRRVRNQRRQAQAAATQLVELPQSVRANYPIVEVTTHDAWWLCGRSPGRRVS